MSPYSQPPLYFEESYYQDLRAISTSFSESWMANEESVLSVLPLYYSYAGLTIFGSRQPQISLPSKEEDLPSNDSPVPIGQ